MLVKRYLRNTPEWKWQRRIANHRWSDQLQHGRLSKEVAGAWMVCLCLSNLVRRCERCLIDHVTVGGQTQWVTYSKYNPECRASKGWPENRSACFCLFPIIAPRGGQRRQRPLPVMMRPTRSAYHSIRDGTITLRYIGVWACNIELL